SRPAYPPPLHSFPTRRSSDLAIALTTAILAIAQKVCRDQSIGHLGRNRITGIPAWQLITGELLTQKAIERSILIERTNDVVAIEIGRATSELQSLAYLVCRLL